MITAVVVITMMVVAVGVLFFVRCCFCCCFFPLLLIFVVVTPFKLLSDPPAFCGLVVGASSERFLQAACSQLSTHVHVTCSR